MSDTLLLVLYVICALGSAFFASSETAITSLSDATIFRMKEAGRANAQRLERLRADLAKTIGTLLVGNTLMNAAAGSLGAAVAISLLGEKWGVVVATAVTSVLLLVVAEVTPKTYAARRAESLSLAFARPVEIFVRLFTPLTTLLSRVAAWILAPLGVGSGEQIDVTQEDVKSLIALSHQQGTLEREEKEILHAVLDFGETPVRDAMVPRAKMVEIPAGATYDQVDAIAKENRYSRYPVYRWSEDDVIGILHLKDLYDVSDAEEKSFDLSRYLRPAVFVPELKKAGDLFGEMRRRRFHMAVVVDELGAVTGLVTLEDLIERIVGDISDEHDEPARRPVTDGTTWIVEGTYPLASLERELGCALEGPRSETVAGFVLRKLGRIPRSGARTREGDLEFVVDRATARAIERVRIVRRPLPGSGSQKRKAS